MFIPRHPLTLRPSVGGLGSPSDLPYEYSPSSCDLALRLTSVCPEASLTCLRAGVGCSLRLCADNAASYGEPSSSPWAPTVPARYPMGCTRPLCRNRRISLQERGGFENCATQVCHLGTGIQNYIFILYVHSCTVPPILI